MIAHIEQIERNSMTYSALPYASRYATQRRAISPPPRHESGFTTELARGFYDVEDALRLVYNAYRKTGLIPENAYEMRATKYHLLPTSNIFLARDNDETLGTLTLVRDGVHGLPMEDVFPDEIAERRERGIRMAEVSCLADAGHGKSHMLAVVVQLMSHMAQFALRNGVRELVIAVHPHHMGFYERFAGFEVIGNQRAYGAVLDNPAVALAVDLTTIHIKNPRVHQRFFGNPFADDHLTAERLDALTIGHLREVVEASYSMSHEESRQSMLAAA
jgi:hypothetical protein